MIHKIMGRFMYLTLCLHLLTAASFQWVVCVEASAPPHITLASESLLFCELFLLRKTDSPWDELYYYLKDTVFLVALYTSVEVKPLEY